MKTSHLENTTFDLAAVRERLRSRRGPRYWRSLEEVARTKEFVEFLHREFPARAAEFFESLSRRDFLKLMGASLAMSGLTACTRQPAEKIVPYVKQSEDIGPGKPLYFDPAMTVGGLATGLLI